MRGGAAPVPGIQATGGNIRVTGDLQVDGDTNLVGGVTLNGVAQFDSNVGFFATAPTAQAAVIANADGTLADATTKLNAVLAALRAKGLVDT